MTEFMNFLLITGSFFLAAVGIPLLIGSQAKCSRKACRFCCWHGNCPQETLWKMQSK